MLKVCWGAVMLAAAVLSFVSRSATAAEEGEWAEWGTGGASDSGTIGVTAQADGGRDVPEPAMMSEAADDDQPSSMLEGRDAGSARKGRAGTLAADVNGYQDLRWGMKLPEVQRRMPGLEESSRGLWVKETVVAGFPAFIGLAFKNGKLKEATVQFSREIPRGLSREEHRSAIINALTKKYGAPKKEEGFLGEHQTWSNDRMTITASDTIHGYTVTYTSLRLLKEVEEVSPDGL
ncbi:hypothetical protein COCOR_04011 [Corallococcus coralloides DSM 2259]|uniref:Lipoprotein n=1 Tax=Corallococcus coralloides (strain ATCC 25202 / DSM 2259 / NBRC 100086 / M2) TaxID=1144275 RepID=H8MVN1_CORCM|nr:hypothetical protein [Corallococcus coralloides]AFE05562.1 hypothetical protein COCOR_04011 [Corallococcus coralloides DSM 2259]